MELRLFCFCIIRKGEGLSDHVQIIPNKHFQMFYVYFYGLSLFYLTEDRLIAQ